MADARRMTGREIALGFAVLVVVFVLAYVIVGALNLPVPQWAVSGIAAFIGIIIWMAVIGRLRKAN